MGNQKPQIAGQTMQWHPTFGLFRFAMALSVLRFEASDYPFGIFQHLSFFVLPWHCLSCDLRLLIAPLVSSNICRQQRGNQKPQIAGQTMPGQNEKDQMLEDKKGAIRSGKSQDRQCNGKTK
jgi:hypothetical protein